MPSSAEQRAAAVDAMIFDVDGVLTNGGIVYGDRGEWKVFHAQDGHGFTLARRAGLKLALLSGRSSEAVRRRAQELKVDVLEEGVAAKGPAVLEVLAKLGIPPERACFVGDDVVDLPAMANVGFPVAVANAVDEVKQHAAWVTRRSGGEGAAREAIEFVLKARGLWAGLVQHYLEDGK